MSLFSIISLSAYNSMPSDEAIAKELEDILSSSEFAGRKNILVELFERFIDWIFERIDVKLTASQLETGAWIALGLIVFLALLVIVLIILRMRKKGLLSLKNLPNPEHYQALDLLALCDKAAADGLYSNAAVWLYLAFLRFLMAGGYISADETKTNREYIAEARASGYPYAGLLTSFTPVFYRVRYGGEEITREEFLKWNGSLSFIREEEAA